MALCERRDEYLIRSFDTDCNFNLKPSAILGCFQESAGMHAEDLGVGEFDLRPRGLFWVLNKIYVEVDRLPRWRETVTVFTFPHVPSAVIYERSFRMTDANGESLVRAVSRWAVLNTAGRIMPSSRVQFPEDCEFIGERPVRETPDWTIPIPDRRDAPAFEITIGNSEYDQNMHVNNIHYADYLFNCFPAEELKKRRIRSFQLHYIRMSHEGDTLRFYREETAPGDFTLVGVKNGAEEVVASRIRLE